MAQKFLLKVWWCYIWRFHDWTSPVQEGVKVVVPPNPTQEQMNQALYDMAKLYCKRCGCESELNKKLLEVF